MSRWKYYFPLIDDKKAAERALERRQLRENFRRARLDPDMVRKQIIHQADARRKSNRKEAVSLASLKFLED
jgi:hypothetical protein